ncbi:MAG TPA: metallophosphoesterase [Terracidiphilus sp.]|nr:metallophosphoesterase [Terracidiphilus sp.]
MTPIKRALSLFDIHWPLADRPTLNAAFDFMKRERVDIGILGGDNLDCGPISRHTKSKPLFRPRGQMKKDLDTFDSKVLTPFEKLLPKDAIKVWLTGNHEDWATQLIEEQPELDGLLDFPVYLRLKERGWKVFPQGGMYTFGHLDYLHGDVLPGTGARACQKALDIYVSNMVFGHGHTAASATKTLPHGTKWRYQAYSMGCVGRLDHHYLKKAPTGWVNQIGITEFYGRGYFTHYPVTVINGRFAYGGKQFGRP